MAEDIPVDADIDDDGSQEAAIDEPLDSASPRPAVGLDTQLDAAGDEDDSGVSEALRAWAAGGHSLEDESGGDEILPVQFAQLEQAPPQKVKQRFSRINNVTVEITVELGRKEMSVRELTNLKPQDVIDLDKLAGEAFDILINKRQFAEGEIVVVTDLMAVRITRLLEHAAQDDDEE